MLNFIKRLAEKDTRIVLHDLTKHAVYTLAIVFLSSCITYFLLRSLIRQDMQTLKPSIITKEKTTVILPNSQDEAYTERGSPYDNRTVGAENANVIFHGSRDKKQIALTFDAEMTDGMRANFVSGRVKSSYDKRIIDVLNSTNTKATLFLTGMWIELYPNETREFSQNPLFELGSHSYTDSSFHGFCYGLHQLSSTLALEDIGATEKLLREHARIDNNLFRFPGGCYAPEDVKLVNQAGDTVVHWDVVGADGFNENIDQIVLNVVGNTQNGSIIVLHMNGAPTAPKTADALPRIIEGLKKKGFEFVKVSELLHLTPAQRV